MKGTALMLHSEAPVSYHRFSQKRAVIEDSSGVTSARDTCLVCPRALSPTLIVLHTESSRRQFTLQQRYHLLLLRRDQSLVLASPHSHL